MNDSSADIINVPEALERVDGDRAFLRELLDEFTAMLPEQLRRLREAMSRSAFEESRQLAHSIKGAGRNLGAGRIALMALQTEAAAMEADMPHLQEAFKNLENECRILSQAVREGVL